MVQASPPENSLCLARTSDDMWRIMKHSSTLAYLAKHRVGKPMLPWTRRHLSSESDNILGVSWTLAAPSGSSRDRIMACFSSQGLSRVNHGENEALWRIRLTVAVQGTAIG